MHSYNKHIRPRNTRMKMYAGYIMCCRLVRNFKYAMRAISSLEKMHHALQ